MLRQAGLDRIPGHAPGQHGQGVTQVDHLIEPGAKEVVGYRATGRRNSRKYNGMTFETGSYGVTCRALASVFMRGGGVLQGRLSYLAGLKDVLVESRTIG